MDAIQRKLARIDDQLAGRTLRSRLVSTAPLFFAAMGLIVGILLQDALPGDRDIRLWIWLILLAGGTTAAAISSARSRDKPHPETLAYACLFCFACLGAVRMLAFEKTAPSDVRHRVGPERILATVRGRILTPPRQEVPNWCFAQFVYTDPSSAFYMRLDGIKTPTGWRRADGTIRVHVNEPTPNLQVGDLIQVYCWLHRFEEPTNPGQFNLAEYLRLRDVHVGASVPARDAIEVCTDGRRGILASLRRTFANAAARGLLDDPPADAPAEAVLEALLLGERRDIDPDTYEAFRKTGLLHLISLSGMHMGILVGIVWWFCKLAGLMKPARAGVCILATIVFLLIVPPRAPTLRAVIIVWAFCTAILLRRRVNPLNSLSLAAIILLLLRPTQLFEAGWQLSFAAVAGILAFTGKTEDFLLATIPARLHSSDGRAGPAVRLMGNIGREAIRLFSAGFAAWLGSAGILLYHFYTITPLASLWTALTFLPVAAILTLGFLKILLFFLLPSLSALLGIILSGLAAVFIHMVELMAKLDFCYILIGRVPLAFILLTYATILFAAFVPLRPPALKKGLCGALTLVLLVCLGVMKWQRTHRSDLCMTCLDVGHGQAVLVQLPGTMNVLFDAGSLYGSDVGTRIISPFLDYMGIGRLHAMVASHHDIDHINGIPEVADRRRVGHVYADEASFLQSDAPQTRDVLLKCLAKRRLHVENMPRTVDAGPAQIRVLWPTDEWAGRQELGDNDKSLVCLIEFAGRKVLLCSDIERLAQREILRLYPGLRADVVVAPHHGSTRTLLEGFLEQLDPTVLLCSCSRRDYELGRVAQRPSAAGKGVTRGDRAVTSLFTAQDGALSVCIDGAGMVRTAVHK